MDSARRDIEVGSRVPDYRLKSRKLINHLFTRGAPRDGLRKTVVEGPILISFDVVERPREVQAEYQGGVTTNRRIQRAVDRNRIKRALREGIAMRRPDLLNMDLPGDGLLIFMVVFRASSPVPVSECRSSTSEAIKAMIAEIERINTPDGTT